MNPAAMPPNRRQTGIPAPMRGDTPDRTPAEIREVTQELLKHGFVEEAQSAEMFRRALVHQHEIAAALEPLDLALASTRIAG